MLVNKNITANSANFVEYKKNMKQFNKLYGVYCKGFMFKKNVDTDYWCAHPLSQ